MKSYLLAAALTGLIAAPAAAAIDTTTEAIVIVDEGGGTYSFTQGGFSENALISGSFSGSDTSADGMLTGGSLTSNPFVGPSEITDFTAEFSGNSLVGAFSFSFSDLGFLAFDLGGNSDLSDYTSPNEAIITENGLFGGTTGPIYLSGVGAVDGLCTGSDICGQVSGDAPATADVPAPAPLALVGLGLLGLSLRRRRS